MSEVREKDSPGEPEGFLGRMFQAFRYRDFRLLWLGAFTSTTGTWMQLVAQSWLVYELTGSAFYLGLVGFMGQLPHLLFSLLGGAFADRIDRRRMLLLSQYTQMATAFVLTALVLLDVVTIWHFLVLVFVIGVAQAFGGPAYQALIPGLVNREDVPNAIALNSIQFNLARVAGPLLARAALDALGAAFCFLVNGLSFLAVIATLYMIRATFTPQKTTQSVVQQIGQGLTYVREQGALWQLTLLGFVSTFCGVPLVTLLPALSEEFFGLGASGYSRMMAISGAGAVTGALLYALISRMERRALFTLGSQLAFALILGLFSFSRNIWLSSLLLFLGGICLMGVFASITSLVQLATVEEMRGRVMSIFYLSFRGGMPLGDLTAGILAARLSLTAALQFLSVTLALTAGSFLIFGKKVRRL